MFKWISNWRRKLKNFKYYKQVITEHREELESTYNVRIDSIWRLYTIYSIDPLEYETYGGKQILHEQVEGGALINGDNLFEGKVKKSIQQLDKYLNKIGLSELYGLSDKRRIDEYNYRVVVRFSQIDTKFWANVAVYGAFAVIIGLVAGGVVAIF